MSCSAFDLKDYFFGELTPQDRRTVDLHLASCQKCQEALDALHLTQNALLMVRDEEPPSRIAFVSDKVFAPRWYQTLWNSGPKMAFVSSAILAGAILIHGVALNRPPVVVSASTPSITEAEVSARVQEAVREAVARSEARQSEKFQQLVSQQKRLEADHKAEMKNVDDAFRWIRRSMPMPYQRASVAVVGEGQ